MPETQETPPTVPKKKKSAKKRGKRTAKSGINKSEFIRTTAGSAKEVVAAAKAKGFSLSEAMVYAVRSAAKRKAAPTKRGPGRPKGSTNKTATKTTRSKGQRTVGAHPDWVAEAFAMGLDRAIKVLSTLRSAVG